MAEHTIALREIAEADLEAVFRQMSDPESVRMAAFTPDDPSDREAFEAHMRKVLGDPENLTRAVTRDGELVGTVASFVIAGETEVTYWIDRTAWGQGIASKALELLVGLQPARPLYARAASDNAASLRVLEKAGFIPIGTEVSYANARGAEIQETILCREG
ncbi:MAG TPA: GNAT family N-acetyltransferase [Actinospica sp.]|nr:GNAT family N-acetyltransferase [Actinospica sp.]